MTDLLDKMAEASVTPLRNRLLLSLYCLYHQKRTKDNEDGGRGTLRKADGEVRRVEKPKVLSPIFPSPGTAFKVRLMEAVLLEHTCSQLS